MTSPNTQSFTSWNWEQMLQYLLQEGNDGAGGSGGTQMNRNLVAGPGVHWIKFVSSENQQEHEYSTLSAMYDGIGRVTELPGDPGTFVFWRYTVRTVTNGSSVKYYVRTQSVTAKITFAEAASEGGRSPSTEWTTYYQASNNALSRLFADANPVFDPVSFHRAGKLLNDVENWLKQTERSLKSIVDQVGDSSSGLQGTAAGVFVAAVNNVYNDVRSLVLTMKADSTGDSRWSRQVYETSNALWDFRNKVNLAWREFSDHTYQWFNGYHPTALANTVKSLLAGVKASEDLTAVTLTFPDVYGNGTTISGVVNLLDASGWENINTMMMNSWLHQATLLDAQMRTHLGRLTTELRDTTSAIRHFSTPPRMSLTGTTGTGGNPDINGAGTPDLNGAGTPDLNGAGMPDLNGGGGTPDIGGAGASDLGGSGGGAGLPGLTGSEALGGGSGLDGSGSGGFGSGVDLPGAGGELGSGGGSGGTVVPGGSGLPGSGLPGSGLPGSGLPGSGLPGSGGILPGVGGVLPGRPSGAGGIGGSSTGSGRGDDATGADSSLFPTDVDGVDIGELGSGGTGSGLSSGGVSLGSGVADLLGTDANGRTPAEAAAGAAGANAAAGGMPMMPPMGGMGGGGAGQENKERERKTWLEEDEDTWGTDPDCSVAVIGRDQETAEPTVPMPGGPGRSGGPINPAYGPARRRG